MRKLSNPFTSTLDYLSQSISRMIMLTFVFVLLLPLAFLLPSLDKNIWEQVNKDNIVKHKILAASLAEPIKLHVASYQHALKSLDYSLQNTDLENSKKTQIILDNFINSTDNVVALSLLLAKNESVVTGVKDSYSLSSVSYRNKTKTPTLEYISAEKKYRKYDNENIVTSVIKSSFSKQPVFLITHHILDINLDKRGTLIAEIDLGFIQQICGQISFGDKGHCVVVDDKGNTVAHPNSEWVSQIHNLSNDEIVQKIKKDGEGALEYYSSTNQEEMIAGFAKVGELGWGIMVLRPRAEIDLPFQNIKTAILSWVIVGVLAALLIAFFVTRKITRPLSILVNKSKQLDVRSDSFQLGAAPNSSPIEIRILWDTISRLIVNFQEANAEVKLLSNTLHKNLRKAVVEFRENNLKKSNNKDLLTGITNKACFDKELGMALLIRKGEDVGIILVDIDNYKNLVTQRGQGFRDVVIKHVAHILNENIRSADMVARYGDTDQFAIYINYCTAESLQGTAEKLRSLVETSPVSWEEDSIYITLSIGILSHKIDDKITVESLIINAEKALNVSKSVGENKISTYRYRDQAA